VGFQVCFQVTHSNNKFLYITYNINIYYHKEKTRKKLDKKLEKQRLQDLEQNSQQQLQQDIDMYQQIQQDQQEEEQRQLLFQQEQRKLQLDQAHLPATSGRWKFKDEHANKTQDTTSDNSNSASPSSEHEEVTYCEIKDNTFIVPIDSMSVGCGGDALNFVMYDQHQKITAVTIWGDKYANDIKSIIENGQHDQNTIIQFQEYENNLKITEPVTNKYHILQQYEAHWSINQSKQLSQPPKILQFDDNTVFWKRHHNKNKTMQHPSTWIKEKTIQKNAYISTSPQPEKPSFMKPSGLR